MSSPYSPMSPDKESYMRQREMLSRKMIELDHSPEKQAKIEVQFDRLLNEMQFFAKPDIIPYPDAYSQDYQKELSREPQDRHRSMKAEVELARCQELERDYELLLEKYNNLEKELRDSYMKNSILLNEVETLKRESDKASRSKMLEDNLHMKNKILEEELQKSKKKIEILQSHSMDSKISFRIKSLEEELKNSKDLRKSDQNLEEELRKCYEQIRKLERELNELKDEHALCKVREKMKDDLNNKLKSDCDKLAESAKNSDNTRILEDKFENVVSKQNQLIKQLEDKANFLKEEVDKQRDINQSITRESFRRSPEKTINRKREHSRSLKRLPTPKKQPANKEAGYCHTCVHVHKHHWAKTNKNLSPSK